jgi:hypothetical protein
MELLLGCCAEDKENLQNTAMTKTPSPSIYLQESKTQHQFFFWFFLSGMEIEVTGGTTISLKHTHSLKHIHTPINQIPSPHTSQFQKPLLLETKERLLQIINLGRQHHKSPQNSMIQAERNTNPKQIPKRKKNRKPKSHKDLVEKITASKRVTTYSFATQIWSSLFSQERFRNKSQMRSVTRSHSRDSNQRQQRQRTNDKFKPQRHRKKKRPKNPTN